jgi:hypothetical protein
MHFGNNEKFVMNVCTDLIKMSHLYYVYITKIIRFLNLNVKSKGGIFGKAKKAQIFSLPFLFVC